MLPTKLRDPQSKGKSARGGHEDLGGRRVGDRAVAGAGALPAGQASTPGTVRLLPGPTAASPRPLPASRAPAPKKPRSPAQPGLPHSILGQMPNQLQLRATPATPYHAPAFSSS